MIGSRSESDRHLGDARVRDDAGVLGLGWEECADNEGHHRYGRAPEAVIINNIGDTEDTMAKVPHDFRTVIVAASVGNVIEWYDFYIFGSLAAVLSVKFFEQSHPVAALLSTIALFTAGFLIRPLGAFLFGWMGDRVGRKYTFLVTLSGVGLGTGG